MNFFKDFYKYQYYDDVHTTDQGKRAIIPIPWWNGLMKFIWGFMKNGARISDPLETTYVDTVLKQDTITAVAVAGMEIQAPLLSAEVDNLEINVVENAFIDVPSGNIYIGDQLNNYIRVDNQTDLITIESDSDVVISGPNAVNINSGILDVDVTSADIDTDSLVINTANLSDIASGTTTISSNVGDTTISSAETVSLNSQSLSSASSLSSVINAGTTLNLTSVNDTTLSAQNVNINSGVGISLSPTGFIEINNLPDYPDDLSAGLGGVGPNQLYRNSSAIPGVSLLSIKL